MSKLLNADAFIDEIAVYLERLENMAERIKCGLADQATAETMLELIDGIDEAVQNATAVEPDEEIPDAFTFGRAGFEALAKMSSANKVDIDICFDHDGDIRVTISPSWSWRLGIDEEGDNVKND